VSAKPPVMIFKAHGSVDDEIDRLNLANNFEDPVRWEDTIRQAFVEANSDSDLSALLQSVYLQADRAEAFETFSSSSLMESIAAFIGRFGITEASAICDLGCGPGHLAYALLKRDFRDVTAMDPNGEWNTGTGYLRAQVGDRIGIINDRNLWKKITGRFDAIISQATIHHWQHIPLVAIDVRRTMKPGAFWFVFAEYFANSPREFVDAIKAHPTASRYGSYEWAYPPQVYVDLIQSVGLNLVAVVPYFYKGNALTGSMRALPSDFDAETLNRAVDGKLVDYH
jgi:SAM-dependent methyltransferase